MSNNDKKNIRPWVFWPPAILMGIIMLVSLVNEEAFATMMTTLYYIVADKFGWLFMIAVFSMTIFLAIVLFSPMGRIRMGGKNAKPQIKSWNYFAMSLCAGIAIGILFWGVAQPLDHFFNLPESLGIESGSRMAGLWSMASCIMFWTFSPYALYLISGIAIGYAVYNMNQPFTVSAGLAPLLGSKYSQGWIGQLVDAICLFSIAGCVAASIGMGVMQLGAGLNTLMGVPISNILWAILALVIIFAYTLSSYTGIKRGIRVLSDVNTKIFFVLLIYVFIVGPTVYCLNLGVNSIGYFFTNFASLSLWTGWTGAATGDMWPQWWSLFYWGNWFGFAPIVGMWIARISYGRTIRQILLYNWVAPAIFGMVWFIIFGGTAIYLDAVKGAGIQEAIASQGLEVAIYSFFAALPLGKIFSFIFVIVAFLSFTTLADSMTTCVASLSTKGGINVVSEEEPPARLKIIWGLIMGGVGLVMVTFAGIGGVKMISVIVGLPTMILSVVILIGLLRIFYQPEKYDMVFESSDIPMDLFDEFRGIEEKQPASE